MKNFSLKDHKYNSLKAIFFVSHRNHINGLLPIIRNLSLNNYNVICCTLPQYLVDGGLTYNELISVREFSDIIILKPSILLQFFK